MTSPEFKLPETDSIEELAKFWDTHDLTCFEDDLEEVVEPVFVRGKTVKIRLEPEEYEAVQRIAASRGLAHSDIIHEWVAEKVQGSRKST